MKKISLFPSRFGFFPYIFLFYLLFPVYYLTLETGSKQLMGYGMLLVFFITYRQLYFTVGTKAFSYWLALQLSIVFIYSLFYDINYIFLGFFPANFIGFYREKPKFFRSLACLVLVLITPFLYYFVQTKTWFSTSELLYFVPFLVIMLVSPFGIRSMNRRMELERQLDQANKQIEELVKREERMRIARDLHDKLGHTLSLLTLKSQLVQRLIPVDAERAQSEAKDMELTSRAALKQVRELVSDMRTATIAEELIQVQHILRAADITYRYEGDADFSQIPPLTQNIVSLCMREAATNIVKHSRATHCTVSISLSTEKISIVVRDDGAGIDKSKRFGNGLKGMQERLSLIDGELQVSAHNGTVVHITIPVIRKAERKGAVL